MVQQGFDNALFLQKQKQHIAERIAQWGGKLYLEFGGKLFDDYHAARVLPGYDANGKINLLREMREQTEIIFAVSADDIEKTKVRADLGISYDMEVLRLMQKIVREQDQTLVMVTHDNNLASYADRRIRIMDGRIVGIETGGREALYEGNAEEKECNENESK